MHPQNHNETLTVDMLSVSKKIAKIEADDDDAEKEFGNKTGSRMTPKPEGKENRESIQEEKTTTTTQHREEMKIK